MSHNLKTPLNSLILNNEIIETQITDKNSLAYEVVEKDRQNLTLLNFLVCDILDFSRVYSNEFHPNYTYFRLDNFLQRMKDLFWDQAMQKGLHIEVQTSNIMRELGLFTEVYMDQQRLQ
jgi:signal transduction histidine kinase